MKEKSSDETRKKTDEPIPDVEGEASDEDQVDIKENDEIDGKDADDEEENVSTIYNYNQIYEREIS